ncbi:hypothetical protein NDU88_008614 [Pleurodeles waltl]|uniref:Uncharacterized protein n=1 Tax=Pleurodeles waltl TaxID=8319 RepID=A0AAV7PQB1_PLEWA|nr:hypothetical protein NDU88_008614 [Pleurodeles waltl]
MTEKMGSNEEERVKVIERKELKETVKSILKDNRKRKALINEDEEFWSSSEERLTKMDPGDMCLRKKRHMSVEEVAGCSGYGV